MAATASSVLTIAMAEIGTKESPSGSNKQKYGLAYGLNGQPWCMIFVWWCFNQAKADSLFYGGAKTASCSTFMKWAKLSGRWHTSGYQMGDIILYNFDGDSTVANHTGICESATSTTVTCIEGNTSTTSDDNGGAVMRRTRKTSLVIGAYRPAYGTETTTTTTSTSTTGGTCTVTLSTLKSGSTGNSVKSVQLILIGNGYSCGSSGADGDFGANTLAAVKKFQKAKGLTQDGIVGTNTWTKLLK